MRWLVFFCPLASWRLMEHIRVRVRVWHASSGTVSIFCVTNPRPNPSCCLRDDHHIRAERLLEEDMHAESPSEIRG